jgi:NAD(P)-dependent dehydrogenase (short-subunit alcohol dehydrogenase family)
VTFDLQLIGSRALVTGGTRGLGAAVVATLHRAGAHVVAAARSLPAQPIDKAHYVVADLATADDCAALAKHVLKRHGGLDIVVNVVGGSRAPAGGFAASDDAVWRQELNQNLMPAVRIDRALLPPMIEQGSGVIIRRLHRSDCVGQIQAVDAKLAAGGQGGLGVSKILRRSQKLMRSATWPVQKSCADWSAEWAASESSKTLEGPACDPR